MTQAEARKISTAARRRGKTLSAWLREIALAQALLGCGGVAFDYVDPPDSGARRELVPNVRPDAGQTSDSGEQDSPMMPTDAQKGSPDAQEPTDGALPNRGDASNDPNLADAQSDRVGSSEASTGAPDVLDGGAPLTDARTVETSSDAGEASVCTPITPSSQGCGQSWVMLTPPAQWCRTTCAGGLCNVDTVEATPPECQCAETYSCACVVAHGSPCAPGVNPVCSTQSGSAGSPMGAIVHLTCN